MHDSLNYVTAERNIPSGDSYIPKVLDIKSLRPADNDTKGKKVKVLIDTLVNSFPTYFKDSGVLKYLYSSRSAITGEVESMILPEKGIVDFTDFLSNKMLDQHKIVSKVTSWLVGKAGSKSGNILTDALFDSKMIDGEKRQRLRDTWSTELKNDPELGQAAGMFEFGVRVGEVSQETVAKEYLTLAMTGFLQNQMAMHPEKRTIYKEILTQINPDNPGYFKLAQLSEWNVWVGRNDGNVEFLGRKEEVGDMYIRMIKKDDEGQYFKDVTVGSLITGNWSENIIKELRSENWLPEIEQLVDEADRIQGPPLFAVTLNSETKDVGEPQDDFDKSINKGQVISHLNIRNNGTASLLCSHMPVDGGVMEELKVGLEKRIEMEKESLDPFFQAELPEISGAKYNVKTRPFLEGAARTEVANRLGLSEVEIEILLPEQIVLGIEAVVSKMPTALGYPPIEEMKKIVSELEVDQKVAMKLLFPWPGKYGIILPAMNAWRITTIENFKRKGKSEAANLGKSAVACVPPIDPENRLGVAGISDPTGIDWIGARAVKSVKNESGSKEELDSKTKRFEERVKSWLKIPGLKTMVIEDTKVSQQNLRDLIRLAGFNISALRIKHYLGETREKVNTIAGALNSKMKNTLSIGMQMSNLKKGPFSTAMPGDALIDTKLGITDKTLAFGFKVDVGIGHLMIEDKIETTMNNAREGLAGDPGVQIIRKVMTYTEAKMTDRINLEEMSKRIEILRNSKNLEDNIVAKEATKWLVFDTYREMAAEMTMAVWYTAKGYDVLLDRIL